MRLLFVNENIGGHTTVHLHLERALRDRPDLEVDFLHVPPPGPLRRLVGARLPGLARLDLDLKPLRMQLALSVLVRERLRAVADRYDALYVYTHNAGLLAQDVLRARPSVVALDATNAQNAYRLPYRKPTGFTRRALPVTQALENRVYDSATLLMPNSEWAAASLRSDYGVAPERIRIVPAGLTDPGERPAEPAPSALPRIIFVGRSMERKGGNLLLRLHREHLVGRCVLTLVTPERVAAHAGVEVVNDIRPGDARLWSLLRSSRLFAFPSEIDMFPNVVLEAMAAGLPVVAASTGAIPEIVPDGEAGILAAPGDGPAFLAAIELLLEQPDRAAALGAAARRRFEEVYDARVVAPHVVDVLREAVERHRRS